MEKFAIYVALFFLSTTLNAQQLFHKTYFPDSVFSSVGISLLKCNNGDYLFLSDSYNGKYQMNLTRVDSSGNSKWCKSYYSSIDESPISLVKMNDTSFIIIKLNQVDSNLTNWFSFQSCLIKINENGDMIWNKKLLDPTFYYNIGIKKTIVKGSAIYCAGTCAVNDHYVPGTYPDTLQRGFIMKADTSGNLIWIKKYGDIKTIIEDFELTPDSGLILIGYTEALDTPNYKGNLIYFKTNLDGNVQWAKAWNQEGRLNTIVYDSSGFVVGGYLPSGISNGTSICFKIDGLGNVIWANYYSNVSGGDLTRIIKLNNGNLLFGKGFWSYWITDSVGLNPMVSFLMGSTVDDLKDFIAEPLGGVSAVGYMHPGISFYKTDSTYSACTVYHGPTIAYPLTLIIDSISMPVSTINAFLVDGNLNSQTVYLSDSVYCQTYAAINNVEEYPINIYPNPFTDFIIINLNNIESESVPIQLFDLTGRSIATTITKNQHKYILSTTRLVSGIYILKIAYKNLVLVKQIIKI